MCRSKFQSNELYFIAHQFFNGKYVIDVYSFETDSLETFKFDIFDDFKKKIEELGFQL